MTKHRTGLAVQAEASTAREHDALLSLLPFAAALIDTDAEVVAANCAFRSAWSGLGRPTLYSRVAIADRAALAAAHTAALIDPGSTHFVEASFSGLGGRDRAAAVAISAFRAGAAGIVPQRLALVQCADISVHDVRLAEARARAERIEQALVASVSGTWDADLASGTFHFSTIWRQIRGLGPADPVPTDREDWLLRVHPDDRHWVHHCIERQYAGDPLFSVYEYRERHTDGRYIWIECRGACVSRDADGRPLRAMGVDADISTRKRSEEDMTNLSRRLKLALEVSRIGVFEADFTTGVSDWDDGMMKVFGIEGRPEVTIGGLWESMLHPDDAARVLAKVEDHVENLAPFSDEYRVALADGSERFIRSRTLPFIDKDGHLKMIGANWDVTADLALHRELERAKTLAEARNRELEAAKASIEKIALHDHLTGLPNRRFLDETLERYAEECARSDMALAVLHIDLDRFKQINDTLGHAAGDCMLAHAAATLKSKVAAGDFVARIGGDEFVFLARRPCAPGAQGELATLAETIVSEMRRPVSFGAQEIRSGASIGIAFEHGAGIDPRRLLQNADIALYDAKNAGRNRHAFFSQDIQDRMVAAKQLADDLLRGLERNEFVPFYQFQFDALSLEITSAETLVRWRHPVRGLVAPAEFLDAAEELGILAEIDGRLLEMALADLEGWRRQGLSVPRLSVNVSARRLHDPELPAKLDALEFAPGSLSFELLESIFLDEHNDQVVANLAHMRRLGIRIEIDDFGSGHASIVSLLRLNPNALKIDRQLIHELPQRLERRNLVGAIIDIGHSLGIEVVAEGVETPAHIAALRALGCDRLQGYALARPMANDAATRFIGARSWFSLQEQVGAVQVGTEPGRRGKASRLIAGQ